MKSQASPRLIPSKSNLKPKLARIGLWRITADAIAKSNWWQMFIIAAGSASSIIYPHVPLAGFAAVAGNTLTRQKALISVMSIWFANQLYGFVVRQYPRTFESFAWGLVMGLGILLVTWLVTWQPRFSRYNFWGYLTWLAVSFVGGYAIYQGSIVLIAQLTGGHGFSLAILWGIFVKNAIWVAALAAIHSCAVLRFAIANQKSLSKLGNRA